MRVTVVGGGYVGLVSAICFCEFGFNVSLVERNAERLEKLRAGNPVVYEVGLSQGLKKTIASNTISFSDNLPDSIADSDAIVIAVATTKAGGPDSDLSSLTDTVKSIALALPDDRYVGILIKTSVPVGTCSILSNNVKFMRPDLVPGKHYDVIANPGFLREGSAVRDFMTPNRAIIGMESESSNARELISKLYSSLFNMKVPFIYTNFETAELIRAATISFMSTKMAFINEMAEVCDRTGADINTVIKGVALDQGIGYKSFVVSPGIGGSSFPRTVRILVNTADSLGVDLDVLNGVMKSNTNHIAGIKDRIVQLIDGEGDITHKKVSILGLAFKPLTNDVRESASILVVNDLLDSGIPVYAYDPLFKPGVPDLSRIPQKILNDKNFHVTESVYEAAMQSDILVIMTNWTEFVSADFDKIYELMNKKVGEKPIILDYRNMFLKSDLPNFNYISQGTR